MFEQRFSRVSDAVKKQDGARIPGASRLELDLIDVPDSLWEIVLKLVKD